MRHRTLWFAALLAPLGALTIPRAPAPDAPLVRAAAAFLDGLAAPARGEALFVFTDAERTNWAFVPGRYPGVLLAGLDLDQRRLAHALLRAALSESGYQKTLWIMRLEGVLRERESTPERIASHRDPERYAIALFGDPRTESRFALRIQGHHVSWNLCVVGGELVAGTPRFLGSNPAEMRDGPYAGTRALGREDDAARALLGSLDAKQLERAILPGDCPADIVLGPGRAADLLGAPRGIAWQDLREDQQALAWALLGVFAADFRAPHAEKELARIRDAGRDGIAFAWIGSTDPQAAHYWRLHGPGFAIESCNIQNGANHVHTVWNDLTNGFGADVLRAHLQRERK